MMCVHDYTHAKYLIESFPEQLKHTINSDQIVMERQQNLEMNTSDIRNGETAYTTDIRNGAEVGRRRLCVCNTSPKVFESHDTIFSVRRNNIYDKNFYFDRVSLFQY